MICKKCGQEIDKKAVICTSCGCKVKKPIYKKWWFWVLIFLFILIIGSTAGNNESTSVSNASSVSNETEDQIVYEVVDLQTMFDELDGNAMKAESNYQNKTIEFQCKIKSFDSDGDYISVEPVGASQWNFSSAMCYIKDTTQKDFLLQKNVGDMITIKGKVKSVGEVIGYSIDINEVY